MEIPAISVIIPLYNVEKYIGECLDSLLARTFKNFEVIVVDDCSTDNSCAIAESYAAKINGHLTILHMKKNSGGAGLPRNKGLEFACGEYIYFLDPDDAVTPTALEELYSQAKKFNADIVQCEKFYRVPNKFWNDNEFLKQLKPRNYLTGEKILVNEPLIWDNNFEERIKFFVQKKLIWNVVMQFIRRDFIIENEIRFCDIFAEDMLFFICELCAAKKYVVVPNVIYYYRLRENSTMSVKLNISEALQRQIKSLKVGIQYLDKFLSDYDFFSRRPDLKCALLNTFAQEMLRYLNKIYIQVPDYTINEFLREEFGENSAFESFIFNALNVQRIQIMQMQNQFNQFAAQAQQRIAQLENELNTRIR